MEAVFKIGLGGGCHWCTEAVFQSLNGVAQVEQGYISAAHPQDLFSEAVIVHFDRAIIPLSVLLDIHLLTHKSTSNHSMRAKYRSAVYVFSEAQAQEVKTILDTLQNGFKEKIITAVLPFSKFKPSREAIQNYYYSDPKRPFCERFINPKLQMLLEQFSSYTKTDALKHLNHEQNKT